MKLSVVIPIYDEAGTVEEITRKVEAVDVGMEKELILVDDCSTDGTRDILKKMQDEDEKVVKQQ